MHGEPALPADFKHLPYANPDAPKGGKITYGVQGTFDSLNPFILKSMRTTARGIWEPAFGKLVYEPLMQRSADEPFTLYGLLAEKVETDDGRSFIEFTLNTKARWSDGKPVTPEDVIFTYDLMSKKGRPPFNSRMKKIGKISKVGTHGVRFDLNEKADREFPLILGLSPVLPKHAIDAENFDRNSNEMPIGSGPYIVDKVDLGQRITYRRNPDYWGKDIPSKRGFDNYDKVTIEYFRSSNSLFEAFKKGIFDVYPESDPAKWRVAYDIPAVKDGRIKKDTFTKGTPKRMIGFVFNTRKPVFQDRRVRQALSLAFDFEWANKNLFYGQFKRTVSFFDGSELSSVGKPASDYEKKLLAPFKNAVLPDVINGTYRPPVTDASGFDRKILKRAYTLLREVGFTTKNGVMVDGSGKPIAFEFLSTSPESEKLALAYQRTLKRLGIQMSIRTVDDAEVQKRKETYNFDMIVGSFGASLSPGAEQLWRWASPSRDIPGTFNLAGAADPAIDAMIDAMIEARDREAFVDTVRAYDRLLISGHYIVPLYHLDEQWLARWSYIQLPDVTPLFGYHYPVWWDARAK